MVRVLGANGLSAKGRWSEFHVYLPCKSRGFGKVVGTECANYRVAMKDLTQSFRNNAEKGGEKRRDC